MLTIKNYFQKVKDIDVNKLPANMQEAYAFAKEATENHTTWDYYNSDKDIQATIDQYLANLSSYLEKPTPKSTHNKAEEAKARDIAKQLIFVYALRGENVQQLNKSRVGSSSGNHYAHIQNNKIHVDTIAGKNVNYSFSLKDIHDEILAENEIVKVVQPTSSKTKAKKSPQPSATQTTSPQKRSPRIITKNGKPVERIDEELKFIKRYVLLHGKVKTDIQILNFINALQKSIIEKRIRKTSAHAEQIIYIQNSLLKLYNKMGTSVQIKISDSILGEMMEIAGSEKVRLSTGYMKRYISIQGKNITKEKAQKLYNLIANAVNKSKMPANDPNMDRIKRILNSLRSFVKTAKKDDTLHIHEAALNGIHQALDGCDGCDCGCKSNIHKKDNSLQGITPVTDNLPAETIMNSVDFAKMQFDTLGFEGKWLDLIGDPSRNFTVMVFGPPKMGKSYLCVYFAAYLARNHGKVLYVAKEEGLDFTLQEKLNEENIKHPNLFVTGELPGNIDNFDFIFLDSVTRLGLTPLDLRQLKEKYPEKSFIYVFQSTKQGAFRGENGYQHDVDVIIEVPEKGKAVQMGRFNQGGTMDIFSDKTAA